MAKTKEIQDFGEKIGGARKDAWKTTGLSSSDLLDMNEAECSKYVNKNNIWPKPDWRKEMESGIPQVVAYWQNEMRRALRSTPVSSKETDVKNYVSFASSLKDAVMKVRGEDEVTDFYKFFFEGREYVSCSGLSHHVVPADNVKGIIDNKLLKASQVTCMSVYKSSSKVRDFGLTEGEKKRIRCMVLQYDEENVKLIKRDDMCFITIKIGFNTWSCRFEGNADNLVIGSWMVIYGNGMSLQIVASNLETKKEAEKAADEFSFNSEEKPAVKKKAVKANFKIPYLSDMVRVGPDVLSWRHADADMYLNELKFRGGEFGNWVNDKERAIDMDMGYEAFRDLADVLGIEPSSVSLDGTLAIAFGSRGNGGAGAARAHYEPERKVINLTKKKGGGCLAHEWGHALDHMIGEKSGAEARKLGTEMEAEREHLPSEFTALVDAMKYDVRFLTEEEQKKKQEEEVKKAKEKAKRVIGYYRPNGARNFGPVRDEWNDLTEKALDADIPGNAYIDENITVKEIEDLAKCSLKGFPFSMGRGDKASLCRNILEYQKVKAKEGGYDPNAHECGEKTVYCKASEQFDRSYRKEKFGYWSSDTEMFARAFDCYVNDKIKEKGNRSDYLTAFSDSFEDNGVKAYPDGEEREKLDRMFDALIEKLKDLGWLERRKNEADI